MNVVKNLKFLLNLSLCQKALIWLLVDGILDKKEVFSRLQNCYYEIVEIFAFFLGGGGVNPYTPHFGQKLENSSELVAHSKRPWYDVWWCCRYKRSLSGLQKCHSKIVEKFAFSHGERFPRFWSKTWKFFRICLCFIKA